MNALTDKQRTIETEVSFSGIGLHTGNLATLTFKPAPADSGVTFIRADLPDRPAIKADIEHVTDVLLGTTLGMNGVKVHTVEHVLAALAGLGIDNINIELDANETPVGDGSSLPFMTTLKKAGLMEQDAPRKYITLDEPVHFRNNGVMISLLPADDLRLTFTIAYDHAAIGSQYASYKITPEVFEREIASARTFCFLRDVRMLQEQGLGKGGSLENAVVIGDEAILNDNLRWPDEFVRHKILDLLGDLYLLGRPFKGHVVAVKSGHASHVEFGKVVKKALLNGHAKKSSGAGDNGARQRMPAALEVNSIMKVLPHRYPFLLVDRILSYVPYERVVGIKNVTVNEPFFQGHWPGVPVMPGVLIIEVMAQVSSVLIFGDTGEPEKLAFFLGIDKAKFRRTVIPGDQIVVESTITHLRRTACKVKAVARVEGTIVAEAEMLFGLTDPPE